MSDLVTWLRLQLDEDERVARGASERSATWRLGGLDDEEIGDAWLLQMAEKEHMARHDPARALAEVEAKRRILDEQHYCDDGRNCYACSDKRGDSVEPYPCPTVRLLALPYADQPGYREEWRP